MDLAGKSLSKSRIGRSASSELPSAYFSARVTFAPQEMTKIRTTAYQLPFSAVCSANITKITSFGRCGANITSVSLYG